MPAELRIPRSIVKWTVVATVLCSVAFQSSLATADTRRKTEIKLRGPADRISVGGSGRYFIAFCKTIKLLTIVDIHAVKVVKEIKFDDDDVLIAAGATKFVVLLRNQGIMHRFSLPDAVREKSAAVKEKFNSLAMGAGSEGPIFAAARDAGIQAFIDLTSLNSTPIELDLVTKVFLKEYWNIAASDDGSLFTLTRDSSERVAIFKADKSKPRLSDFSVTANYALPSTDGKFIYTGQGVLGADLKVVGGLPKETYHMKVLIPAIGASTYFSLDVPGASLTDQRPANPKLRLHAQGQVEPLVVVDDVELLDIPHAVHPTDFEIAELYRRLYLVPSEKAFVSFPNSRDRLLVQQLDVAEEIKRSGR